MSRLLSAAALAGTALLALPLQALPQADRWIDRVDRADRWQRDPVARALAPVIGKPLDQAVIVQNRPSPAPVENRPSPAPVENRRPTPDQMKNAKPDGDDGHRSGHHRGPENRLVDKYDRFAGSDENARELVTGLRNDGEIELSKGGKTTKFTPATGKMGWGEVDHALVLAKASLAEHGIHKPTPEQIKAALNGGTITTKSGQSVQLDGVLKLRASGMGWGQIAHKHGVKFGDLKHGDKDHKHGHKRHDDKHADWKHDRKHDDDKHHHHKHAHWKHDGKHDWKHDRHDWKHDRHERADWKRHDRPDFHRAKFDRPHRPHRAERPEKYERPHRPERPERHHHRR